MFEANYDWTQVKAALDKEGTPIIRAIQKDDDIQITDVTTIGDLLPKQIMNIRKYYLIRVEIVQKDNVR